MGKYWLLHSLASLGVFAQPRAETRRELGAGMEMLTEAHLDPHTSFSAYVVSRYFIFPGTETLDSRW